MTDETANNEPKTAEITDEQVEQSKLRLNNRKLVGFGKLPKTVEQLNNTPGVGVAIGDPVSIPIPKLPKKRRMLGKKGTDGAPAHEPTQAMRQYAYDFMCQGGTQLRCAFNLGISRKTLVKYYDFELTMAESRKDEVVDGVLMRNAIRADGNKDFQRSLEFYYKRHGKIREQLDVTSGGKPMENIIVVPTVQTTPTPDSDIPE